MAKLEQRGKWQIFNLIFSKLSTLTPTMSSFSREKAESKGKRPSIGKKKQYQPSLYS